MSAAAMLPRIHLLDPDVANQIAAGEVIERPASVVKELLENSIDAASRKIIVTTAGAGTRLISVQDDGQGIHRDDLVLALQPHATSKLNCASDLEQIASLGFRGEALPSIASVSRFQLLTRQQHADNAWSIDNSLAVKPAARTVGTTVEVRDLFHATPARRKFLKSERTEWLHIQSLVKAVALGHSHISFELINEGQHVLRLPASADSPEKRVADVCGKSFLKQSVCVDAHSEDMRLRGWTGLAQAARSQSDRQYFFINGRLVQDKNINHAVRLAYRELVEHGRFPSYVLFLQLDPATIDMNVHPAKSEVRFAEPRNVHDFIYASLTNCLNDNSAQTLQLETTKLTATQKAWTINESRASYQNNHVQKAFFKTGLNDKPVFIFAAKGKFLIVDTASGQLLIDVIAANKLIAFHNMLESYGTDTVTLKDIHVPVSCKLEPDELDTLHKHEAEIKRWGFLLEPVSPDHIAVRTIPALFGYADIIALVKDLLTSLNTVQDASQVATTLAEHVNTSGSNMNDEDVALLVNKIQEYETSEGEDRHLPWRLLDQASLATLLKR